ncbi:MAG: hypothetical protein JKX99_09595 [Robiginitomaculum sp.]|nr:hypothetical protein [Robiginitomaculum sp.]
MDINPNRKYPYWRDLFLKSAAAGVILFLKGMAAGLILALVLPLLGFESDMLLIVLPIVIGLLLTEKKQQ